jgi:hypothetical protein
MQTDIKMVIECVDRYQVIERTDGGIEINILVPARFKNLWMVRLSEFTTTQAEIDLYERN